MWGFHPCGGRPVQTGVGACSIQHRPCGRPQAGLRRGAHLSPRGGALGQAPLGGKPRSHGDYHGILEARHGPEGGQEVTLRQRGQLGQTHRGEGTPLRRRDAQENEPGSWKGVWGQTGSASRKPRGVVTEGAGQERAGCSSPWVGKGKRPPPPVREGGLGPELREERGEEGGSRKPF